MNIPRTGNTGFIKPPFPIMAVVGIAILSLGSYAGITLYKKYRIRTQEMTAVGHYEDKIAELEERLTELELHKLPDRQKELQVQALKNELTATKEQQTAQLQKLSNLEIVKKIKPSVVFIETKDATGSGFIISEDGLLLTNAHVVGNTKTAKITLTDKRSFDAIVLGINEELDAALLKVEQHDLPKLLLGDSDEISLQQGSGVFTFGFPLGIEGDVSFKEGTVSRRLKGKHTTYIEISAEVHPGNSGGPLISESGQVVGINTAKIYEAAIQGIGLGEALKLAIPINEVKSILSDLQNSKNVYLPDEEKKSVIAEDRSPPKILSVDIYRKINTTLLTVQVRADEPVRALLGYQFSPSPQEGTGGWKQITRTSPGGETDQNLYDLYIIDVYIPAYSPYTEFIYEITVFDRNYNVVKIKGRKNVDSTPKR